MCHTQSAKGIFEENKKVYITRLTKYTEIREGKLNFL